MRHYQSISALAVCAVLAIAIAPAGAADLGGYGGYKDGTPPADEWAITGLTAGGLLIVKPKYEGSDEYEAFGFPYIFPVFGDGSPGFFSRIDARGLDDIRFKLIERDGFIAGPIAGYNLGRDDHDGDLLRGLGDVDGGVVAGGFVGYQFGPVLFDVSFRNTFGDDGGYLIGFGAEIERPLSERLLLTARIGANYADDEYMQNYFGVTAAQAVTSVAGLPAFDAGAGFKDIYVELGLKADLDAHWSARTTVRYSRLVGDAADSPVVESEDQFTALVGLSYKFDLGR
jgi:MipA family protein